MKPDLFVFAGEASGDAHGASILKQLLKARPSLKITGVGGPKMRKLGMEVFMPMEYFQIMGYADVFKNIAKIIYYFKKIQNYILKTQPKAVLFIDYPGFNLRMAKALRKRRYSGKLIHYICPTVWAHGKKRINTLSQTLDLLLSIYPFEEKYFKKTKLKPTYIGHPLIEQSLKNHLVDAWKEKLSIPQEAPLIGIFPGSRSGEIKQNVPKILQACELYLSKFPSTIFLVSVLNPKLKALIEECLNSSSLKVGLHVFLIPSTENHQIMSHIKASIATSGTINFELGVMKVPTVVVYHLTKFNAWIARYIIKLNLPYYCIVNIITKKHIFPELYHLDFIPERVATTLEKLTQDSYLRENSLKGCEEMLKIMDSKNSPSRLAAEKISSLIHDG